MAAAKTAELALQPQLVRADPPTPMTLLHLAMEKGAGIEQLAQLLTLQERYEANQARKAFVEALNSFKAQPPLLEKIKPVDFPSKSGGQVRYNYAPLDYIAKSIGEALSKHDLSFRWNVEQTDRVKVTCVLQHRDGHSESVTMEAGLHDDQRMNAIQRLGSTVTYLERYTLLAVTGMATSEQDKDGNDAERLPDLRERLDWIANCNTVEELMGIFKAAVKIAMEIKDFDAVKKLTNAKDEKYKELTRR